MYQCQFSACDVLCKMLLLRENRWEVDRDAANISCNCMQSTIISIYNVKKEDRPQTWDVMFITHKRLGTKCKECPWKWQHNSKQTNKQKMQKDMN